MPLAHILRPKHLADYVGQPHLTNAGKPIEQMVAQGQIFSLILWGPPGTGKTTLAKIIAKASKRELFELSAVSAGKKDLRELVENTKKQYRENPLLELVPPVVFIDEVHRFNKAQQDYLLPHVEDGTLILIGATTENPSFELNNALLSRCKVLVLRELEPKDLDTILTKALKHYKSEDRKISLSKKAHDWLLNYANGDARRLLNSIEATVELYGDLTLEHIKSAASTPLRYDKTGEEHHDTISAFIKSMRASQPDAAVYYLARMIAGGEDPKFIARRMIVFAAEDIGLAQPTATVVATAAFDAVERVGLPEAEINLAQACCYLSLAKKDRSSYNALRSAQKDVATTGNLPIPLEIRNAPTQLMKKQGYSKGYGMYSQKSMLPKALVDKKYLKR